jgi:hypothetical protein
MAATDVTRGDARTGGKQQVQLQQRRSSAPDRDKAGIQTTEFWAMVGLVVAILISAAVIKGGDDGTDPFIARHAWLYVSIPGGAYFISRGLAKSGSPQPHDEDGDVNR